MPSRRNNGHTIEAKERENEVKAAEQNWHRQTPENKDAPAIPDCEPRKLEQSPNSKWS